MGAMRRILLLAEREFTAYVATVTFWIALALGPIGMAAMVALSTLGGAANSPASGATPVTISVDADDPVLLAAANDALASASNLTRQSFVPTRGPAATHLSVSHQDGQLIIVLRPAEALPPIARAFILDRISLRTQCGLRDRHCLTPPTGLDRSADPVPLHPAPTQAAVRRAQSSIGRVAVATVLWLTLTGSLGMLLQAVVRERTNRGLETLLAVASPLEIVLGKLAGVGAVSTLVMGAWIGTGAGLSVLVSHQGGLVTVLLSGLAQPTDIARATLCFVLAYLAYGLATVAIGSTAGDTAAAQNMSRPLFAVLLIAFLALTATATDHADALSWLVFLPPFTPFLLITGDYTPGQQIAAVCLTLIAIGLAAGAAQKATRLNT